MTILVIAEHDNATLKSATLHAIGAAAKLGGDDATCWSRDTTRRARRRPRRNSPA